MSKLKLLILDANVVIFLHDRGIWSKLIAQCEVSLPGTVIDESAFFDDDNGDRHYIDLSDDISNGRVDVFDVPLTDLQKIPTAVRLVLHQPDRSGRTGSTRLSL